MEGMGIIERMKAKSPGIGPENLGLILRGAR